MTPAHHDPSLQAAQPSLTPLIHGLHPVSQKSLLKKKKKEKPADYFENVSGIWSLLAPSSAVSQMVATSPLTGSLPPWLPELCPLYRM